MKPRRTKRVLAFCALFLTAGFSLPAQTVPDKPNIIFILADDLGYGDLGCYGQKLIQTPRLDRMAADGMRFTQFYAGSTVCAPSRCVLMTGLHTGHCHVRGNARVPLRPEDTTVAEVLKKAGYATGLIGKWGLGEPDTTGIPNRKGFDYFFGYLNQQHAHNYYPDFLWRNQEKVPLPNEMTPVGQSGVATKRVVYTHDLFAQEALDFVDKHKGKPFFLYLALTIPHANNEATRMTGDGQEVPDYGIYEDKNWTKQNKGQAAMITRMDADVGRLLDKLKETGLERKTLVIFSSDNGPHKEGGNDPELFDPNGPLRGMKRDLYEGGIRVPTMAWWPGTIKPGSVSDHVGYFGDLMATAAELAGMKAPEDLDSISFAPTLLGQTGRQRRHEFLYWEFHENGSRQAVRMGDWKAVRKVGGPLELYDLSKDIGEQNDVASLYPKVTARIEANLKTARTDSEAFPMAAAGAKAAGKAKQQQAPKGD